MQFAWWNDAPQEPIDQDEPPTAPWSLRYCAYAGCEALLSRHAAHPCCFVHRQVMPDRISLDELKHQVRYGQLTDWPGARYHADLMNYGDDRLGPLPAA